jgi:hypothetical protein
MACYDEIKSGPDAAVPPEPYTGPRVVRDGNRVDEISSNAPDFVLHVRPRRFQGRDGEWRKEE